MKYGFIGLGAMGKGMSANLIKAGYDLVVCDTKKEMVDAIADLGAEGVYTNAEVGQKAEKIFLSLPNAAIVKAVLDEITSVEGSVVKAVYDTSTTGPKAVKEFVEMGKERGFIYCDCPVAGGSIGAEKGTLSIMVGAEEDQFNDIKEVLDAIGKNITLAGPVGTGAAVKMFNNYLGGIDLVATCEVMVMAKQLDMDLEKLFEIINKSTGRSFSTEMIVPGFLKNRDFTPGFMVDLFYKDMGIALETANDLKLPVALGPAVYQSMGATRAMGLGREHSVAIVKYYEELAGVKVN